MEREEIVCEVCGKTFESSEQFRVHSAEMHDVYVPESGGQGRRAAPDTDDNTEA
jgi:hypothetical protein